MALLAQALQIVPVEEQGLVALMRGDVVDGSGLHPLILG
jgi:hypothetical protein